VSNVNLHIGGRTFTVACGPGEEDHIAGLGRMIDEKLQALVPATTSQSESRMLLFAALVLADELHETKHGAGAPVPPPPPPPPPPEPQEDMALAQSLEMIAERLENCATRLEAMS